jgi:V8-like Glu-specific endopeptidase
LVSPDTVVTAGHCARTQESCVTTSFVFGFKLTEPGLQPHAVPSDHVYSCQTLVHSVSLLTGEDFAVIKLDRPVTVADPLPLRLTGVISPGAGLRVVGHPSGLPVKIAGGAVVREVKDQYLVANLDTYGGNSGSAVFNEESGEVEGILVRGEMDYETQGNCRVSKRCASSGCRGEDVTLIGRVLPYLN